MKLRSFSGLMATVMLLSIVLVACAKAEPTKTQAPETTAATTTQAQATTATTTRPATTTVTTTTTTKAPPKPTGTMTIALGSMGNEGFVPGIAGAQASRPYMLYDYVLYVDAKTGNAVPGLAEKFSSSPDAATWTFNLRKGVQFQDGWGEVTSADVKFTFDLIMAPASVHNRAPDYRKKIKSIDTPDPYTVIFQLSGPDPVWWMQVAYPPDAYTGILSKKYFDSVGAAGYDKKPIGSGPYKVTEHVVGQYLKYEAVESHWRLVPEFKTVIFRVVPEESTAIAMLKRGEVDVAAVSPEAIADVQKSGLAVSMDPSAGYTVFFAFGGMLDSTDKRYKPGVSRTDPWKDVRVREAMNLAIDRKAISKVFYNDSAVPMSNWMTLPGWQKLAPIPYDAAKAKQLLAAAGYPTGFSLNIQAHTYAPGAELPKVAEALVAYWEAIGIKSKIRVTDYTAWRPQFQSGDTQSWIFVVRKFLEFDWAATLNSYHGIDGSLPTYSDQQVQGFAKSIGAQTDVEKRNAEWAKLGQYMRDNYVTIPLVLTSTGWAYNPKTVERVRGEAFQYIRHATPLNTFRLFDPTE